MLKTDLQTLKSLIAEDAIVKAALQVRADIREQYFPQA